MVNRLIKIISVTLIAFFSAHVAMSANVQSRENYVHVGEDSEHNRIIVMYFPIEGMQQIDDKETVLIVPKADLPLKEGQEITNERGNEKVTATFSNGNLRVISVYKRKSQGKKYSHINVTHQYSLAINANLSCENASVITGFYGYCPASKGYVIATAP